MELMTKKRSVISIPQKNGCGDQPSNEAVVVYLNLAGRRREQKRSQRRDAAMDAAGDAVYLIDRSSMRFVHVNDSACRMQGKTRERLLALDPSVVLGASRTEHERIYDALIVHGMGTDPKEMIRRRPDGTIGWFEVRRQARQSGAGWHIAIRVRDVTARKVADMRAAYLNQVLKMLRRIGAAQCGVHSTAIFTPIALDEVLGAMSPPAAEGREDIKDGIAQLDARRRKGFTVP